MKSKWIFLLVLGLFLVFFIDTSSSLRRPRQGVYIEVPYEVNTTPGKEVKIEGKLWNTGRWWLRNFKLWIEYVPKGFNYTFEPNPFKEVRIIRAWSPKRGLYKLPERFNLTVSIPENASGKYLFRTIGQEFTTYWKYSNSSMFYIRVITSKVEKPGYANFSFSDIVFPETVVEFEPFNISFFVENIGNATGQVNLSISIPEDWNVSEKEKSLTLKPGESSLVEFTIIPTNTSGQIVVFAEYPYKQTILNITKQGPILIPVTKEEAEEGLAALLRELSPYLLILAVIFLAIIIWNVWGIYKVKISRKREEKMVEPSKGL